MKESNEDNFEDIKNIDVTFEELTGEELVVNIEDEPLMVNIPYVKVLDSKGDVANPIGGFYRSPFPNRAERRSNKRKLIKNPKNNKKGTRLVVTKIGNLSYTKTYVKFQNILANKIPIIDDQLKFVGWEHRKKRTIVHNQVK